MPIPLIIAGVAAAVTGVIGAGAHISAKETNEKAQRRLEEAQELYEDAKESLEEAQNETEQALETLGYNKKEILDTSMAQFVDAFEKIKAIDFTQFGDLNEISKFKIDRHDIKEIKQLANIYSSSIKSGVSGAALGGGAIATGLVAGSVFAPLAIVAAPIVLFTGISAALKADENLEKANVRYAEAEAAAEKMKTSELLCEAITEKAEMLDDLLENLNQMFAECTAQLAAIVDKKTSFFKPKLSQKDLTKEELKLAAVTGALAQAVKTVIDTPVITKEGKISRKNSSEIETIENKMSMFESGSQEVLAIDYNVEPISAPTTSSVTYSGASTMGYARNMIAFAAGLMLAIFFTKDIVLSITNSSDMFLFISATNANTIAVFLGLLSIGSMFFGNFIFGSKIHKFLTFSFSISAVILYVQFCRSMESIEHYIKIPGAIMLFACVLLGILSSKEKRWCSATFFSNCFLLLFLCVLFFYIYLFFAIYLGWFSHNFWLVATTCAFGLFVLGATQIDAYEKNN